MSNINIFVDITLHLNGSVLVVTKSHFKILIDDKRENKIELLILFIHILLFFIILFSSKKNFFGIVFLLITKGEKYNGYLISEDCALKGI